MKRERNRAIVRVSAFGLNARPRESDDTRPPALPEQVTERAGHRIHLVIMRAMGERLDFRQESRVPRHYLLVHRGDGPSPLTVDLWIAPPECG